LEVAGDEDFARWLAEVKNSMNCAVVEVAPARLRRVFRQTLARRRRSLRAALRREVKEGVNEV
jgi:hypothetical protein